MIMKTKVLLISADKYQHLSDISVAKHTISYLKNTFETFLKCEVHELKGNSLSSKNSLLQSINKCTANMDSSDALIVYYCGRAQKLIRNDIEEIYIATNNFLPGRTRGSIKLQEFVDAIINKTNSLIILDSPITISNKNTFSSIEKMQNQFSILSSGTDLSSFASNGVLSPFSLIVDRIFRHSFDTNTPIIIENILEYLSKNHLLLNNNINYSYNICSVENFVFFLSTNPDYFSKLCNHKIDYSYISDNIYSMSSGSRLDGINELEAIIYDNNIDPILKDIAKNRLEYLSSNEEEQAVIDYLFNIRVNSKSSPQKNFDLKPFLGECRAPNLPKLVHIPSGKFYMGSDLNIIDKASHPKHMVYTKEYDISIYLITVLDYAIFVQDTDYDAPSNWIDNNWLQLHKNHPVTYINYYDACNYCSWLTKKLQGASVINDDQYFRLPTEAEWEKAARGLDERLYPWGDVFSSKLCNVKSSAILTTTPVGSYSPQGDSPFGCCDMIGNVREWTSSLWGTAANVPHFKYPYDNNDGREAHNAPKSFRRIVRGGGFYYDDECSNCVTRNRNHPENMHSGGGFRIVLVNRQ